MVWLVSVVSGQEDRPNFLLILADDMTWSDIGGLGHPEVKTPHLDRLLGDGMRLANTFTPAPMCAPTRMSLYTGLYPVRSGGHPNHSHVHRGTRSLPHYLGEAGYRVGLAGKRHVGPRESFPFERIGRGRPLRFEQLRRFVLSCGSTPWCAVLASAEPHTPWNKGDSKLYDPAALTVPPWLMDTRETRVALSKYYAEVSFLDAQVGRAMGVLESTGQAGRTLVLFLTEQGAGLPFAKWTLYDQGIRATAIARWPGKISPGTTSGALISYVDVVPTLLDAAGAKPVKGLDGRSFLSVLLGESPRHRAAVFAVQTSRGISNGPRAYGSRAVRTQRYKLIYNLNSEASFRNNLTAAPRGVLSTWPPSSRRAAYSRRPKWELYDLEGDPFELTNRVGEERLSDVAADLRAQLRRWMRQQGDLGAPTELDALNRQPRNRADRSRSVRKGG